MAAVMAKFWLTKQMWVLGAMVWHVVVLGMVVRFIYSRSHPPPIRYFVCLWVLPEGWLKMTRAICLTNVLVICLLW